MPSGECSGGRLPVHETFHAWQGEGAHQGRSAFFVRLMGCPVRCPWCDAAGTWHPDHIPQDVRRATAAELAQEAAQARPAFVVVTGGEPAVHDLAPLVESLHACGLAAHVETCGGFELRGDFDWVTVSPKWARPPREELVRRADELKIIVEDAASIPRWWEQIGAWLRPARPVWLQPQWGRRDDPAVIGSINRWVKERGDPFRATWQLHKLYRVDADDPRSRAAVPLGGDPRRGL